MRRRAFRRHARAIPRGPGKWYSLAGPLCWLTLSGDLVRHRCTALLVVALACVAPRVQAQVSIPRAPARTAAPSSEKSPTLARVIGIVPGAGHVYAGEPEMGLIWFTGTLGVAIVGGSVSDAQCSEDPYTDEYCSSTTLDIITAVAVAGVWGWSIVDAGRAARRTNARRVRLTGVVFDRTSQPGFPSTTRIGLQVGWPAAR
jgi:hypothetical protein